MQTLFHLRDLDTRPLGLTTCWRHCWLFTSNIFALLWRLDSSCANSWTAAEEAALSTCGDIMHTAVHS